MIHPVRKVAILGSTGSIGCSTLEVVQASGGRFHVSGLTANARLQQLSDQAQQTHPRWIVATDPDRAQRFDWKELPRDTELLVGSEGVERVVTDDETDIVVAAIVGSAGLRGAWLALQAGKTVALANKETLVAAGPLVMKLAQQSGGRILPVDSEHSAVFQALQSGQHDDVQRIVLTASGGPFRNATAEELQRVTVEDALAHPTWNMGPKITVDSATMMNKALEIIEARWLFNIEPDRIEVVIHPQSIVHSMVEFKDGSVIAQMSPPDMKLPIQYALTWPERWESPSRKLDFSRAMSFDFSPPDPDRFPALQLGFDVARQGGTAGAVLNAANEAAVSAFLSGEPKMRFVDIVSVCRTVLNHHNYDPNPTLEQLMKLDVWAREEVTKWIRS